MYIVKCQLTESPELHYFYGLSDLGEPLYTNFLSLACRYPTADEAERVLRPLLYERAFIRYIIEPEELNR